ncbi:M24 family metallopeptidase [Gymnodinialimonas hymeniacidonis]|uniref:M24 family metallopeptidase n=1 Tax=Gymnodinialimonas hymeniacidonis TaxID=3126508 RepID=UPI0034C627E3
MTVPRGFPDEEFRSRCTKAQSLMAETGLDALLLTTEVEVRYYTGFLTRFWESPTRPWFVVLPATGAPIAVIPSIGTHLMQQTWVDDIRTWASPDYDDDGIGLLVETLRELVPEGGRIGLAAHLESHVRMPRAGMEALEAALGSRRLVPDDEITWRLRMVKSEAEIAKITAAVGVADRAFNRVGEIARVGVALSEVFRRFQMLCLDEGADWVPYLAGAAGQGGYNDVISPATNAPLRVGDVLMLDTGVIRDGYFSDFDRNFSVGAPAEAVKMGHSRLIEAIDAGLDAAKPGARFCDIFHAMNTVVSDGGAPSDAGRLGHGLGMQLTEGPSIIPADQTVLEPGMVLTLEPSVAVGGGKILVHEEDIVIRENGPVCLSQRETREMRVI